jgi:hypothetical protein
MNKRFFLFIAIFAAALAACQSAAPTSAPNGFNRAGGGRFTPNPEFQTQIASNPAVQTRIASGGQGGFQGGPGIGPRATPTPTPSPQPTDTPEPTATPVTADAVQSVQAYFAALQSGQFGEASKLVSSFSLMANRLTAGDVVVDLTRQRTLGAAWSGFQVKDSQVFNDNTILVHVTYHLASIDPKTGKTLQTPMDELWPVRYENKKWRYNWTNIIDFRTLGMQVQLSNGLTISPLQLTRYTDKMRLTLLAQNGTDGTIVIGTTNQTLAVFHFGDQSVTAEQQRYLFNAWRSYSDVTIDVKGLFNAYPDSVEIVKFNNTVASPWFTFSLTG